MPTGNYHELYNYLVLNTGAACSLFAFILEIIGGYFYSTAIEQNVGKI